MKNLQVSIKTWHNTGKREISYSLTPEEFVTGLQAEGEKIYIAQRACSECIYTPERLVASEKVQKMEAEYLETHMFPECICGGVARMKRIPGIPDFIGCYAFYYLHWHRNMYLKALREASLIEFYDISVIPTLRESGLLLLDPWIDMFNP